MTRPGAQVGRLATVSHNRPITLQPRGLGKKASMLSHNPSPHQRHANGPPGEMMEQPPSLGLQALLALLQAVRVLEEVAEAYAQEEDERPWTASTH